jgi:lipoprotein-anchoring transpeptidase ErfK/SrfK
MRLPPAARATLRPLRVLWFLPMLVVLAGAGAWLLAAGEEPPRPWAGTWVATAQVAEVGVYPDPAAPEPRVRLRSPTASGAALVFLVDGASVRGDWLPVHLPVRPNGSTGWVRKADVRLTANDYRLEVDLEERELTFAEDGEVQWRTPIGVGTRAMPTPAGRYYVKELVKPAKRQDRELYGPFALGLSGFTDEPGAKDFKGGDGALAIHGTEDPDSIGEEVSHGCIRVPNDVITYLATTLPMGTPVDIR